MRDDTFFKMKKKITEADEIKSQELNPDSA